MSERWRKDLSPDEQAISWLDERAVTDPSAKRAFTRWIRRSPENLDAYLRQQALDTELQELRNLQAHIDREALIARAKAAKKIVRWPVIPEKMGFTPLSSMRTRVTERRWWRAAGLAAGIALLTATVATYNMYTNARTANVYSTGVGEQRRVLLVDGSTIELNTQSSIRVGTSGSAYDVYLLSGEALFDVRHNPLRPFRVHVGTALIEDIGTEFNVRRTGDLSMVAISVLEGSVRVSTAMPPGRLSGTDPTGANSSMESTEGQKGLRVVSQITAGEQIRLRRGSAVVERDRVNIPQTVAWRRGRLTFSGATLGEIVAEFNRYNERKLIVSGEELSNQKYSGAFAAKDPQSFIEYLREDNEIEVEEQGNQVLLRRRRP